MESHAEPKMDWTRPELDHGLAARVNDLAGQRVDEALTLPTKEERNAALTELRQDIVDEARTRILS